MLAILFRPQCVNSSPPSAAYMRQWIRTALVQIMACRLFGAKPLSKPMLVYCHVNWMLRNKCQWNFLIQIQKFSFIKMHLKVSSAKWWPFCSGLSVLIWLVVNVKQDLSQVAAIWSPWRRWCHTLWEVNKQMFNPTKKLLRWLRGG